MSLAAVASHALWYQTNPAQVPTTLQRQRARPGRTLSTREEHGRLRRRATGDEPRRDCAPATALPSDNLTSQSPRNDGDPVSRRPNLHSRTRLLENKSRWHGATEAAHRLRPTSVPSICEVPEDFALPQCVVIGHGSFPRRSRRSNEYESFALCSHDHRPGDRPGPDLWFRHTAV